MNHHPNPLDESLQLLEEELAHLRPVKPTDGLHARILGALAAAGDEPEAAAASEESTRVRRFWFGAVPVAAAAAIAALAAVVVRPAAPPPVGAGLAGNEVRHVPAAGPALDLQPVSAESKLVGEQDEGVTREAQGVYSLQRRRHYLETRVLRDEKTGTLIRINVPREEVLRVPIEAQ